MLHPSLWISGVLNEVFVSGLHHGLVGFTSSYPQWVTFSSVRACYGLPPVVGASVPGSFF